MDTRFSPSTGCFYPRDISYPELPDDLIDVSQKDFDAAMDRPAGHTFAFVGGALVISPPAPVVFSDLAAPRLAAFRQNRETALNRLSGMGFAALQVGDTDQAQEIATVRANLLDVPAVPAVRNATTLPALDAALAAAWQGAYAGTSTEEIATAMAVGAGGGQTRPT